MIKDRGKEGKEEKKVQRRRKRGKILIAEDDRKIAEQMIREIRRSLKQSGAQGIA